MSQDATETRIVCYNHPNRETMLRCNRCEKPICTECAVLTPTGYRCKACVRGQLKVYENAQWWDYPLAILIGAGLSFLGSLIASALGWFIIFVGPIIGVVVAESIRWVVRRRRSRLLFQVATGAVIAGALPLLLLGLLRVLLSANGVYSLFGLIWPTLYAFLVTSTAYYRLSGIRIG
jgi:hypothetical protein